MGMKGHPQSNSSGGGTGGSGGGGSAGGWIKKKIAMVVVVIIMGLMGVMVVQKVKDRRLFNLVIKDKDRQILSLNLLLQKERQYAKENKRKNQDLNAKLYSLRTQKTELSNKIMEMRSTIGSMRDEQRALEMAIDEKQDEIKRKESEIKDLKSNLQAQPKIWSASSNDTLNHGVNLTTTKVKDRGSWFGRLSNVQQVYHKEIKNQDAEVQKPKDEDSETLASSKDLNDNAKIETHNTTTGILATKGVLDSEENRKGLAVKGRRFYIGATESQRDKSNEQNEKSQLKANPAKGTTEVTRLKSNRTKGNADKIDDDEATTKADTNSSRNGSEEDQDYKEETKE